MHSRCTVVDLPVAVNNLNPLCFAIETQQCIPLVLLLTYLPVAVSNLKRLGVAMGTQQCVRFTLLWS
jgi:hypothetical protein